MDLLPLKSGVVGSENVVVSVSPPGTLVDVVSRMVEVSDSWTGKVVVMVSDSRTGMVVVVVSE